MRDLQATDLLRDPPVTDLRMPEDLTTDIRVITIDLTIEIMTETVVKDLHVPRMVTVIGLRIAQVRIVITTILLTETVALTDPARVVPVKAARESVEAVAIMPAPDADLAADVIMADAITEAVPAEDL